MKKEVKVVKPKTIEQAGTPWTVDVREMDVTVDDVLAMNDKLAVEGKYVDTLFVKDEQVELFKNLNVKLEVA